MLLVKENILSSSIASVQKVEKGGVVILLPPGELIDQNSSIALVDHHHRESSHSKVLFPLPKVSTSLDSSFHDAHTGVGTKPGSAEVNIVDEGDIGGLTRDETIGVVITPTHDLSRIMKKQ